MKNKLNWMCLAGGWMCFGVLAWIPLGDSWMTRSHPGIVYFAFLGAFACWGIAHHTED